MKNKTSAIYLWTLALLAAASAAQATMAPPRDAENPRIDERAAPRAQRAAFPSRPAAAPTGSEFLRATAQLSAPDRERAILAEFQSGNLPSHIRNLVPISLAYRDHLATVYVMPDYLALGSDEDYVIMPMAPRTAMRIARQFGLMLPTRKLVDDIYQNAALRLTPEPMQPGPLMTSNAYYREHDRRIKSQLPLRGTGTALISGHKKDIVLTPRLSLKPGKVAIYGWHRGDGLPIQPLSLFHHIDYVDYSHGVRLLSRKAVVDGAEVDLARILSDAQLNPLVSDEGQVAVQSYL